MKKIFLLFTILLFCFHSFSQNVNFSLTSDSVIFEGQPYITFWSSALITNNNSDSVVIEAIRLINIVPNYPVWRSAMCADVCYGFTIDTVEFSVPAFSSQVFEMQFEYTTHNPDTAHTKIFFHSVTPAITFSYTQNYFAMDSLVLASVNSFVVISEAFEIFPNPVSTQLAICNRQSAIRTIEIFDVLGQKVFCAQSEPVSRHQTVIDVSELKAGIYFLRVNDVSLKFIKQ